MTAMRAPVVTVVMLASLPLEVADAADDEALPVDEPRALVAEAVVDDAEPVAASASAVAFRVPHCSFCLHVAWASALFGFAATH